MEPAQESRIGMNRTGNSISPIDSKKTMEGARALTHPPAGDSDAFGENRLMYMREADPVGTMPMPGTIKGAISAIQEKLKTGNHMFMNKLAERLAFERTGTRLYEALIVKHRGSSGQANLPSIEVLRQFYMEELNHFQMLWKAMEMVGGDPTAVTPAADVTAVASMGWVQVLTDPRTTFAQALDVILIAELADHDGWDVLIKLADEVGLSAMADDFRIAMAEEIKHLEHVRGWVYSLNLNRQHPSLVDSQIQ